MKYVTFEVPGQPHGKARHRDARTERGRTVRYTPIKTKNYEHLVRMSFIAQLPGFDRIEEEVYLGIVAFFKIPKSTTKNLRAAMLQNEVCPKIKPDRDNIEKAICDALNGLAYRDDEQVVDGPIMKRYSDHPKVVVRIAWGKAGPWGLPDWAKDSF